MHTKEEGGVGYANKTDYEYDGTQYEADIKTGDTVKILNAGVIEPNNYGGEQHNFKIQTRNGEKKTSFNQSTVNVLISEFGDESEEWIGKEVRVILKKDTIAKKKVIIAYFVSGEWALDEYNELTKPFEPTSEKDAETSEEPAVNVDEGEVDPDSIPF